MTHATQTVRVDLAERSYDIEIGTGNLGRVGPLLTQRGRVSHVVIITDENVDKLYSETVAESLAGQGIDVDIVVVEPGEQSKSVEMADALWQRMLEVKADRKSVVVTLGGGVVGDLAGFIAATYARGLRFLQVPTTLLAQVDSSIGGKVGVNLPQGKNMVGAFLQPIGVLIDTATLDTLPEREYRAGLGELIKHGVILDAALFEYLEANAAALARRDHDVLVHAIARSCRLKADVVQQDEREETGLRAVLNYGHTFAHAFEALSGYGTLLHGEAVAIGMLCASRLAEQLGRVDAGFTERQRRLLEAVGLPTELPPLDPTRILESMAHDKKVQHGRLRFVLPDRLGHVDLVADVDPKYVLAALETRG